MRLVNSRLPPAARGRNTVTLLGVDVGTTHCKVVICDEMGSPRSVARELTPLAHDAQGRPFHPPEVLWAAVVAAIRAAERAGGQGSATCIGVAGMAEAGLFVDGRSGEARSEIIPWYDTRSTEQVETIARSQDPRELFRRAGLQPSFKYGLAKILWLRERDAGVADGAVWLSVPDYIAFRLTGCMSTDPTLAARTYAYSLPDGAWDESWIRHFGLVPGNFPAVMPSGTPLGTVSTEAASSTGLRVGALVAVSGHDHICASLAVGLDGPGTVVDSIGTAESLLGVLGTTDLGDRAFHSGLKVVPHVLPNRFCWLGGTRSSGGAFDWVKSILAEAPLTHDEMIQLLEAASDEPTGVLFFPYLRGSGGVHSDDQVRAAFIGLEANHTRADLCKAALEGTAYEAEAIRRAAERLTGSRFDELILVGRGASDLRPTHIRADVTGCRCIVPALAEATATGAALLAGLGSGIFQSVGELAAIADRYRAQGTTVFPDHARHERYRRLYDQGYEPVGRALRASTRQMHREATT